MGAAVAGDVDVDEAVVTAGVACDELWNDPSNYALEGLADDVDTGVGAVVTVPTGAALVVDCTLSSGLI
jgi:hypothetical protein